ncbi:MAG: Cytochrome c-type biogenesis protein CcmE [Candidatus Gallionella acididurans]|uniref:Cytochrome c-type biogenesis protein CcmE n=1 Tax=Candidatus Gallionella acididurans TaxID=1796491 RepID=A0A139BVC2_9PROT|nr:MAG: Cytochrome c-type biogenesis protein CcmE [Candidatus Gallionella acididurans]
MKPRHKRFVFIAVALAAVAVAVGLVLYALRGNVNLYFTPTQVFNNEAPKGRSFRIGGLVEKGSLKREKDGLTVNFVITDTHKSIPVVYTGILPDLFKEGKGVVAQGEVQANGVMRAEEVLAKHDENYMPPEATDALNKAKAANAADAAAAASNGSAAVPVIK